MSKSLIAVDCGTSRIKFGFLDAGGGFRLVHAVPSPLARDEPGAATQDPRRVVQMCLDGLRRCAAEAPRPQAVVLTGQMGGVIVVDRRGEALTPWLTSMDTRCGAESQALRREAGARIWRLSASEPQQAERLRWLLRAGMVPAGAALALLLAPFVAVHLAAEGLAAAYCERTCIGWTGFADVVAERWDDELARAAHWSVDRLPRIVATGTVVGYLASAVAALTGLAAGLPLVAGPGDQAASLYGAGCTRPGDVFDTGSTFPLLSGVTERFSVPRSERVEVMPSALRGVWHPMSYMLGTGAMPAWFAQGLLDSTTVELERLAEREADAGGIIALPYGVYGQGHLGRAVFWGLDASHRRGQLYRAILEGIACEYALLGEDLAREGVAMRPPVVSFGGGSTSPLLTRMKAGVMNVPFRCLAVEEVTLAGAALFAARHQGWDVSLGEMPAQLVQTDEREVEAYATLLARYRRFRERAVALME